MHSVSKHVHLSELTVKIWMKIDLYCQRQRWLGQYKVCADIRGGSLERASNDSRVIENMDFHGFRRYVFSTLRNKTNVIIYYYLIPCRLSTDSEIYDLGWLWMAWVLSSLFIRYSIAICDLAFSNFFLLIYWRVCLRSRTARDPQRSAGSGV